MRLAYNEANTGRVFTLPPATDPKIKPEDYPGSAEYAPQYSANFDPPPRSTPPVDTDAVYTGGSGSSNTGNVRGGGDRQPPVVNTDDAQNQKLWLYVGVGILLYFMLK